MNAAKRSDAPLPPLAIGLHDPGMTPMLRCGLGGLAAALYCIWFASVSDEDEPPRWPAPVVLGPGRATIEPTRVVIDWGGDPKATLDALFDGAFGLEEGVVALVGTFVPGRRPPLPVLAQRQNALKRTFLQHGKSTTKDGDSRRLELQIDDEIVDVSVQSYSDYAHRAAAAQVLEALDKGSVRLAGWAQPGAAQRHVKYGQTRWEYDSRQALAAIFAITGSVSLEVIGSGAGALVLLEPDDLVRFSSRRPRILGRDRATLTSSLGDAVLAINFACFVEDELAEPPGVRATHGIVLRLTPWNPKQKVRTAILEPHVSMPDLRLYGRLRAMLRPRRVQAKNPKPGELGSFLARNELLAFLTDNIAAGRRWFQGFATARTDDKKKPRFIHYQARGSNLGALRYTDKEGLIIMVEEQLEPAERALVQSVHEALRTQFAKIYDDTKSLSGEARRKRIEKEQERWRMALAGAKTQAQLSAALADLWSRAGHNKTLREHWAEVLVLLKPRRWQEARDLSLVALASYKGKGVATDDELDELDEPSADQEQEQA